MIKSLTINNYALLKNVKINFDQGFSVISGETGAGKSIMLEAISLLLGKRAERFSEEKFSRKAIIEGEFKINDSKKDFFSNNNIDFRELTILRREIQPGGKSYAYINNKLVLLSVLSDFGNQIIEIHTQNQSILIKDKFTQFTLIDKLAKSEKILVKYQNELEIYNKLIQELELIKHSGALSKNELDFLKFQFEELDKCNLKTGEKEELDTQISILENYEKISNSISEADNNLNNDDGVVSKLSVLKRKFLEQEIFSSFEKRIDSVIIELNDISDDLSALKQNSYSTRDDLPMLLNRLDLINSLLQKHNKRTVEDLIRLRIELKNKIDLSESCDEKLKNQQDLLAQQTIKLELAAEKLNNHRNKMLPKFRKSIEKHLQNLGVKYAQFMVIFIEDKNFHQFGNTSISFLFSANKGTPLIELSKVASGGELSRLMLSIKYVAAKSLNLDTLIFDEIDLGVSGKIASLMASMMQEISNFSQVISISHLPQVASKADNHLKVIKSTNSNETVSDVISLDYDERVNEIAKLLSGNEVTVEAFDNARSLLSQ